MTGARPAGPARGIPLGRVILRGVRLPDGADADLAVDGDMIVSVSTGFGSPGYRSIDCTGLIALPALVDLHTHLREPGSEDAETIASGTAAAAAGGYGTVFAMANTTPVTDTPGRVRRIREIADRDAACDVRVVGAVTTGLRGADLAPLSQMAAEGVTLFSDDGRCVDDSGILRRAMLLADQHGAVVAQHAQADGIARNGQINAGNAASSRSLPPWPASAEESVVARDVALAGREGTPIHICHVSTAGTVDIIRWAKGNGWRVTAEVTPHHLVLDDTAAAGLDTRFKVNPPLRGADDAAALRAAVRDGTIDIIATDHAPHATHAKQRKWQAAPFGMTGLETALAVAAHAVARADGAPDWKLLAKVMSHRPAEIGGVTATSGRPVAAGEPASFCLVAPDQPWTVGQHAFRSRSVNSPFLGMTLDTFVMATVLRGVITHDSKEVLTDGVATGRSAKRGR